MNTTLITGASSGIGEAFARKLAARGRNLLLVARSEDKLIALCNELGRLTSIRAQYIALDLQQPDAPLQLFEETKKRELEVEMLINNAGFGSMGEFAKLDLNRELEMIQLNVRAVVELAHRFLEPMRERKRGTNRSASTTNQLAQPEITRLFLRFNARRAVSTTSSGVCTVRIGGRSMPATSKKLVSVTPGHNAIT